MSLLSHKLALMRQHASSPATLRSEYEIQNGHVRISLYHQKDGSEISHGEIAGQIQSQGQSYWMQILGERFHEVQRHLLSLGFCPAQAYWEIPLPQYKKQSHLWDSFLQKSIVTSTPQREIICPNPQIKFYPYQISGILKLMEWILTGWGGILADDMGLGKTLQALAAISHTRQVGDEPLLLLCPASLAFNWEAESKKFFPNLKTLNLNGPKRESQRWRAKSADLIIMTYGTARNDWAWIQKQIFSGIILDEAHLLKNPKNALYQKIKTYPYGYKLAITGTPVANHPKEWHGILDLIHPNLWGKAEGFVAHIQNPYWMAAAQYYLLRRRKEEVLKDLPKCSEYSIYVDLNDEQQVAYSQALLCKDEIIAQLEQGESAKAFFSIFTLIQKLRKICNQSGIDFLSAKEERLLELIENQQVENEKSLVFSQSLEVLDQLEKSFREKEIPYLRLDGGVAMAKRGALVREFQDSQQPYVFLLSTHAAGVGLNLTAASTCIFYDHDWNPSWDRQAQDRAHRLGQKKEVKVFRLICKGTFEEKMIKRASQKSKLSHELLADGKFSGWELEEIKDLLCFWHNNKD